MVFEQSNQYVAALFSITRGSQQATMLSENRRGLLTPRGLHAPPYPTLDVGLRVTHAGAHQAIDNALAKIAKFSVRGPCVVHV